MAAANFGTSVGLPESLKSSLEASKSECKRLGRSGLSFLFQSWGL